jgi:hypothetical protein
MLRIFIDEVGNHDLGSSDDPNHRYLSLTGVIMPLQYEQEDFTALLCAIKRDVFGSSNVVFHRRDILNANAPFEALKGAEKRARFNNSILELIEDAKYRAFTVVLDKQEHKRKYTVWRFHPYHYCLTVTLERYVQFLATHREVGDMMVESRGRKENMQLERAYRQIWQNGTDHVPASRFQGSLTTRELKIQPKTANIAGL